MIAEVIINSNVKKLNKVFDYIIPEELTNSIRVGSKVLVSFGNAKQYKEAFVLKIKDNSKVATKQIISLEDNNLSKENMEFAKLMSRMYFCNIYDCIKLMLPPGTYTKKFENRVKDKTGNFVYLKKSKEEIENDIDDKIIKSKKQIRVLEFLKDNEGIYISDLEMITDVSNSIIKNLEKKEYIELIEEKIMRNPFKDKKVPRDSKLELNDEQKVAFDTVKESIDTNKYEQFLLFGVTGSGKTEVYMQLIEEVIKKGKKAIILVPEISLTPQMVNRFLARFGESIAVLHSKLSVGERYDEWNKIKNNEANIIIGARSAIFAPVDNLGIIIIDEEHDSSYKSDMTPRYNAKDIARYLCKKNSIPLILGSATPDVNTYFKMKNGEIKLLKLKKRANNLNLPKVEIVDLREELANGNKSMISDRLYECIEENLKNKMQIILFLNRRGYSTFVMCRECGFTAKCKNCNITLTYHADENKLKCHYCGYQTNNFYKCPICGSNKIKYFGAGTQKLEEEIKKLFKDVKTIRMDIDTVTKKNSHEIILDKFKNENIDILIGTQMVVKGHHFPKVTLVGVVAADGSLNTNDFRAGERTFQILTQVAGRAGRESENGKVIIQTYNKDNYSIQYAKEQNYEKFYEDEISIRRQLNYPPFCDIILFSLVSKYEKEVKEISNYIHKILKKEFRVYNSIIIMNPLPAPINKIKNRYRWRIIMKCKFSNNVIDTINKVLDEFYSKNYKNTRIIVDVNPTNMN